MADFKILRIRFRWVGNWTNSTSYIKDDVVRYGGKTYVALKTHTSAANFYTDLEAVDLQIPPQPAPVWELMLDGYEWTQDWQTSTFYQEGDIAKKNGIVYICAESHTSVAAETDFTDDLDATYWTVYTSTDNWRYNWNTSTSYSVNDIVKYNGVIYRCVTAHVSASTLSSGLEANLPNWVLISDTVFWRGDWTTSTRYRLNDIIRYNGVVYECIQGHTSAATQALGLENDLGFWTVYYQNVEYKGAWNSSAFRYRLYDIVKYGAGLWVCIQPHTSSLPFDQTRWEIYFPGFEFENEWNSATVYQPGDVVSYGGYNYFAKTNHVNQIPSIESDDWELLKTSYRIRGDWDSSTEYKVGDVVRRGGMLYVAISDSLAQETTLTAYWELLIPGERWIGKWQDQQEYLLGDVVSYISSSYKCIAKHVSSLSNRPDLDLNNLYWVTFIEGNRINVLAEPGDIKTFGVDIDGSSVNAIRREIGIEGQPLTVVTGEARWATFNEINKVYYVSTDGDNTNPGISLQAPWRTIKYACENITGPATIFVKTGTYLEQLPISVPAGVAIVGDELRGTSVEPAPGFESDDMFYVRNASGIRNMTLRGLQGSLTPANVNGTRRPTAGAYVSLDPGSGPNDSSVWITTRSPYIQNVTTFGTACTGCKIDGALHSGGNRSIVANDFTQVLSDGIGIWCTNRGLTEQVSVFSYYAHIGYLAENGGKIRATNGNSSYGTYGCAAEGFDPTEVPITGSVNNRFTEAQVGSVVTHPGQIYALEYTNAGTNYTSATYTFGGAGLGAAVIGNETRDAAIYQARIYTPGDSSPAGGGSYLTVTNNAQSGTTFTIVLAVTDTNSASNYLGMRIFITSGTGAGQYGYISNYDSISKAATVLRESDDQLGWDHVVPGYPIESVLNNTTVYRIEPRVVFNFPGFQTFARTVPSGGYFNAVWTGSAFVSTSVGSSNSIRSTNGVNWTAGGALPSPGTNWQGLASGSISSTSYTVTVDSDFGTRAAYSTNSGVSWSPSTLPAGAQWRSVAYGNSKFVAIATLGNATAISTDGVSWISGGNLPSSIGWQEVAYGNGVWIAIGGDGLDGGAMAYSLDDGVTWAASTMPVATQWVSVTYGNGRFVAVTLTGTVGAYSFNGINWTESTLPSQLQRRKVRYGQGVFLAIGSSTTVVAYSNDGYEWRTNGDDSTQFALPSAGNWWATAFGNPNNIGVWAVLPSSGTGGATILTGARAIGRATVAAGRIGKISLIEPGSGYTASATVTVIDPNNTSDVVVRLRVGNGALAQPTFSNRGTGYITPTTTVTVNGDGYADDYQIGSFLIVANLSLLPGPGDNMNISGINDVTYKIITIEQLSGSPGNFTAKFRVSPILDIEESPEHNTNITIRQQYSQVRLTGHDFLDIGVGNFQNANYPSIPLLQLSPENEVLEKGGGRVFYTSTDQDGNFRVGELFKVEQATGTVTISADLFNLGGLSELSLGGVTVGGTGVVVREFSTDATFTADSNNIIPTQRAIKAYLSANIAGGGANALVTILSAGTVRIGPDSIGSTTSAQVNVTEKMNIQGGISGDMFQMEFFAASFSSSEE